MLQGWMLLLMGFGAAGVLAGCYIAYSAWGRRRSLAVIRRRIRRDRERQARQEATDAFWRRWNELSGGLETHEEWERRIGHGH